MEAEKMEKVAVVGASPKAERYSHKAVQLLLEKGHRPIPVAPKHEEILEQPVYRSLEDIPGEIDTVTLYVGASRQGPVVDQILERRPARVIFNPGAENPEVYDRLRQAGIQVVEACTLVMLRTRQF